MADYNVLGIINVEKKNMLYDKEKRFIDIFGSLIILTVTFPLILITLILVRMETPGCPIFKQERLGLYGKHFNILKIRSMFFDAEKNGAKWAVENDPRVTKIGRIIRKTHIDELPQFVNILKGDMSIVGPRPEREVFTDYFEKSIPGFRERLNVKPGLTGWAQINGGYNINSEEKLKYDLFYIQNRSIVFDLKIMFSTIKVIITGEGAR